MNENRLPSIYFTFVDRSAEARSDAGVADERTRFWLGTWSVAQYTNRERVLEQSEAGLRQFGDRLLDQLEIQIIYLLQQAHSLKFEQARDVLRHAEEPVRLRLRSIAYGSLTLELSVEGFPTLADAFAGNLDLLFHVLENCAPEALFGCVPYERQSSADLDVRIEATKAFELEFLRHASPSQRKPNTGKVYAPTPVMQDPPPPAVPPQWHLTPKANAAWMAANFVLLIPVILSFVAQYMIYQSLESHRTALEAKAARLDEQQDKLITRLLQVTLRSEPQTPEKQAERKP